MVFAMNGKLVRACALVLFWVIKEAEIAIAHQVITTRSLEA